jgi:KDO2-lipid IV(A) lauroyltransferase
MSASNFANYQRALLDCEGALSRVNLLQEEGYLVRFAIFSANLTNFMPEIPASEHADLFKKLLKSLAFESFDRNILNITDLCAIKGNISALNLPQKPQIFCTFHLGSYRIIANLLIRLGHNFSTIVRKEVYQQQMESLMGYTANMKKKYKTASEVHVLNAEEPNIVLKLLRELKAGRSLLVYLDGNVGSGEEKPAKIDFLSQQINIRKGMPYLSYISGVPLVPLISYRQPDFSNIMYIGEPIEVDKTISRDQYSSSALQQLFDFFSKYVASFPEQWEGWNYIHHALGIEQGESESIPPPSAYKRVSYEFNRNRYSIFELQDAPVLFDKRHYSTFEISDSLRNYLLKSPFTNPKRTLGKPVFQELVRQEIII